MNKLISLIAILGMSIAINSCKKEKTEDCISVPITQESLNGAWQHDYIEYEGRDAFLLPPKFSFRFTTDSFYMSINQFSDIIADTNGCGYLNWMEYAKGIYTINASHIILSGIYCKVDYSEKTEGCYNIGNYADTFSASICNSRLHLIWLKAQSSRVEGREIIMIKE